MMKLVFKIRWRPARNIVRRSKYWAYVFQAYVSKKHFKLNRYTSLLTYYIYIKSVILDVWSQSSKQI